jgi:diguanylate cyclase (GGDEF)-like protein
VTEALSSISDAVYFLDADDRFTWVNAATERLLARPAVDLVGRTVWEIFPDLVGSDLETAYRRARDTREAQEAEIFSRPLDRWFEGRIHPDRDDELVVFFRDVHERRTLDEERTAESSLIRAVLNALPSRTAILDADGTILTTNAAWNAGAAPEGQQFAARPGANYLEVCRAAAVAGNPDAQVMADGLEAVLQGRAPFFSRDYAVTWPGGRAADHTWWHLQVFPVDERHRVVVSHTDITDRVAAEHRAAWQARHDHLTALPNRVALHEVIAKALAEDDGGGRVTVLYMDVDGFKQVNDSLGHSAGDLLLRELASRLAHRTRPTDVVGRLGGDEFVVVAHDPSVPLRVRRAVRAGRQPAADHRQHRHRRVRPGPHPAGRPPPRRRRRDVRREVQRAQPAPALHPCPACGGGGPLADLQPAARRRLARRVRAALAAGGAPGERRGDRV